MPTPSSFKIIAKQASPYKWHFLGLAGLGLTLILIALLVAIKFKTNSFPLIGVGFLAMIWGWGVFLIVNWYEKESKFALKLPAFLRIGISWCAAIFMDVWFSLGSIAVVYFIWSLI